MKSAESCKSIEEVREGIDTIDSEIIALLGKRYEFVKAVVRFKERTETSIISKQRLDLVITSRREMSLKYGLDPDVIESIYRLLINYFISEEMKMLNLK
jgi:isochorismate pyruvate lyase